MAANNRLTSRYTETPVVDFYLDTWTPVPIPATSEDVEMELTPRYHERPDLLAYDLYGSPRLWWVFAIRNMDVLVDPIGDFKSGTLIYTPALTSVERLI